MPKECTEFCGAQPLYMQEIKTIRFSVAIIILLTTSLIAHHAKATVMIIDESHQNALQGLLKDQKLTLGNFDVLALLDVRNAEPDSDGMAGGIFDANNNEAKDIAHKAEIIDSYFYERSMPMRGYGEKFVYEAKKYNLDWRLLPALAIRESSGGKFACDNNPFGWASCKVNFESINDAIETVAWNLGGQNPRTKQYYGGDIHSKLYYYNGSVIKGYETQILRIMNKIADTEIAML